MPEGIERIISKRSEEMYILTYDKLLGLNNMAH